jgi:hypothetical protein
MPTRGLENEIRDCDRRLAQLRREEGPEVEAERQQVEERRRVAVIALRNLLEDLGFLPEEIGDVTERCVRVGRRGRT